MKLWGTIEKVQENEDGTLTVSGIASSEAVDSDGEVITSAAMKEAIPDYMKFGALREMHQPIAAGSAISCEVQDDGRTYLEALVVDSESVKKVKAGVLKGFSIGGKVMKRNAKHKNIIEAIKLVEISLVDRPANPEAIIGLVKMEDTVDAPEETTPAPEPPAPEGAQDTEKAERLEAMKKWAGEPISDSSVALQALDNIFWLLCKEMAEDEAKAEQVAALTAAVEALKAFIASEIQETTSPQTIALGDGTGDLEKKGAKYSAKTKAALKAARDAAAQLAECMKAFDDMDEDEQEGEEEGAKAAASEAIQKAAGLEESLAKAQSELKETGAKLEEALAKAAGLEKDLTALKGQKPLKAVPVEKGAEGDLEKKAAPAPDPNDPLAMMKAAQAQPVSMLYNPNNRPAIRG